MLLELVSPAQRARLAADLDVTFAVPFRDVARLRASYYVKHSGIAAAFRLLPARVPSLTELGCPEALRRIADTREGLLLVGGPSSNGKTTTAAAIIDHVNKARACHLLTIENPIEFVHESQRAQISQREVGEHVPDTITALASAVRENADVVFVSDLYSAKEIELALRLASDGAFVVATVEASGARAVLDRITNAFEPDARPRVRSLLADCLRGVVVQHLIRSEEAKSRVAVHEIVLGTEPIASLVREGKTDGLLHAMKTDAESGMQTLDDALERLLAAGKVSAEAAFERSIDKDGFARVVARARPDLADAL